MPMTVKIAVRGNVLNVFVSGDFVLEEAKHTFLEVAEAVAENKSEKVLFDGRSIRGNPSVIERFYYGEFTADSLRGSQAIASLPRFAYILHEPVLDPLRLGETVATNRGMNVRAFDNREEAIQWLGVTSEE